jgi:16S rRNA (uracil1498-N3)-methyltransferase
VPTVHPVRGLAEWLRGLATEADSLEGGACQRRVLSLREGRSWQAAAIPGGQRFVFLSGPEGGLSEAEESAAMQRGFEPLSLGARVLRADTAPLAVLADLVRPDCQERHREAEERAGRSRNDGPVRHFRGQRCPTVY